MEDLKRHEEMEMTILEHMRRLKILDHLIFGGGTMLRLCFDLPRYSVDLDFYLRTSPQTFEPWATKFTSALQTLGATMKDVHEKHFTWLWEFRLPNFPSKLKIEVRKKNVEAKETQLAIAHSHFSNLQVRLRVVALHQMWHNKIRALVDRKLIRDAYDLEFLSYRNVGDFKKVDVQILDTLIQRLDAFTNQDFKSTLGAILEKEEKQRVMENRFSYLRSLIVACQPRSAVVAGRRA